MLDFETKFCVIDTETTGLNPRIHEVVEIGLITLNKDFEVLNIFQSYIKPVNIGYIDPEAMKVNKLSLDFLTRQPNAKTVKQYLLNWLHDNVTKIVVPIGHNYSFDRDFLIPFLSEDVFKTFFNDREAICTKFLYNTLKVFWPEFYNSSSSLVKVLKHLKIDFDSDLCHGAIQDCHNTRKVLLKIMNNFKG